MEVSGQDLKRFQVSKQADIDTGPPRTLRPCFGWLRVGVATPKLKVTMQDVKDQCNETWKLKSLTFNKPPCGGSGFLMLFSCLYVSLSLYVCVCLSEMILPKNCWLSWQLVSLHLIAEVQVGWQLRMWFWTTKASFTWRLAISNASLSWAREQHWRCGNEWEWPMFS